MSQSIGLRGLIPLNMRGSRAGTLRRRKTSQPIFDQSPDISCAKYLDISYAKYITAA
jgi:hypothetical protein